MMNYRFTRLTVVLVSLCLVERSLGQLRPGFNFDISHYEDLADFKTISDDIGVESEELITRHLSIFKGSDRIDLEIYVGQSGTKAVKERFSGFFKDTASIADRSNIEDWGSEVGNYCQLSKNWNYFIRDNIGVKFRIFAYSPPVNFEKNATKEEKIEEVRRNKESFNQAKAKERSVDALSLAKKIDQRIQESSRVSSRQLKDHLPVFKTMRPEETKLVCGSEDQSEIIRGLAPIGKTRVHVEATDLGEESVSIVTARPCPFSVEYGDTFLDVIFSEGGSGKHELCLWAVNSSLLGVSKKVTFDVEIRRPKEKLVLTDEEATQFYNYLKEKYVSQGKQISDETFHQEFQSFARARIAEREEK